MKNATISILGAGWLGMPLAEFLLKKGYNVKASSRNNLKLTKLTSKGIKAFNINLDAITNTITTFLDTDVLIIATTCKAIPAHQNLISNIKNTTVKQIIFISSTSVYPMLNTHVNELTPTNNTVLSQIENLYIGSTLPVTILRFAGLIGPKRNPARFFKSGKLVKQPDGFINLIHQIDCINCIYEIIAQNVVNEIFNGCSDIHYKRKSFYSALAEKYNTKIPQFETPENLEFKKVDNQKLKTTLGYRFVYPDVLDIPSDAF